MTARSTVYDAILAALQGVEAATELVTAPAGSPARYGVLELPAGETGDGGDLADEDAHLVVAFNVRSVSIHANLPAASRVATTLADLYLAALKPGVSGDGWRAQIRRTATSGVISEGNVANVVDSYVAWVVAA